MTIGMDGELESILNKCIQYPGGRPMEQGGSVPLENNAFHYFPWVVEIQTVNGVFLVWLELKLRTELGCLMIP